MTAADRRSGVVGAAELDLARTGADALRDGRAGLAESTAVLREELGRLESTWTGERADEVAAALGESLHRATTLSDDLDTFTAVAERHADALHEVVRVLPHLADTDAEVDAADADVSELWSALDDFFRAAHVVDGGVVLGSLDGEPPDGPGPVVLGTLPPDEPRP